VLQETIGYGNMSDLTIVAPRSALIVDLEPTNIFHNTGSLSRAPTNLNVAFYHITSQELPTITLFNNLKSLTIHERRLRTQFDIYDTPTGFATEVVLGNAGNVIVHHTSGRLGISGTGSAWLGDRLHQRASLAALHGAV